MTINRNGSRSGLATRMNTTAPYEGSGTELDQTRNLMRCVYDFATQGGAVGDIALLDSEGNTAILPAGSLISRVFLDTITQPDSAGEAATVALKSMAAADLLAATGENDIPVGLMDGIPDNTTGTFIKCTADTTLYATVAVEALTGGKFYVFVEFYRSSIT